jgi:hypothetical protein
MATNSGKGHRQSAAVGRIQVQQRSGDWQTRDERTGEFMERKASPGPFKGIAKETSAKDRVQIQNPVTGHWIKVDTSTGRIVDEKRTDGPFKGIAIDGRQQRKN